MAGEKINYKNVSDQFDEIIVNYFGKKELSKYKKAYKSASQKSSFRIVRKDSEETELRLLKERIRNDVYNMISFGETRLKKDVFIDYVFSIGRQAQLISEYALAIELFSKISDAAEEDEQYQGIASYAIAYMSDCYSRQAIWSESLRFCDLARDHFEELKNPNGVAYTDNAVGKNYGEVGDTDNALLYFERALSRLNPKKDVYYYGVIENNIAIINMMKGNFDEAYTAFHRALLKYEEGRMIRKIAEVRLNMASLFGLKKDYEKALTEFNLSISASIQVNYLFFLSIAYLGKANVYNLLGDLEMSFAFSKMSLDISQSINDPLTVADVYKLWGIIYRKKKDYQQAEKYFGISIDMNKEYNNMMNLAETYYEFGLMLKELGKEVQARGYFEESLSYYKKINAKHEIEKFEGLI